MNEFNEKQKKKEKNLEKKKKFSSKLTIIMIVLWILTIIEFIDYYNSPVTVVAAGKPIIYIYPKTTQEVTIKLKNPDVTLNMIIELESSTSFNSILYNEPLPIE